MKRNQQTQMFQFEDTPLFSGVAATVEYVEFKPTRITKNFKVEVLGHDELNKEFKGFGEMVDYMGQMLRQQACPTCLELTAAGWQLISQWDTRWNEY